MVPRLRASMAPAGPQRTSSRAGGSLTMVRRKSDAAATSSGDLASLAPAATSSSAREGVRFQTVSEWPAFRRFMPMGRPMRPRPMSPIFLAAAADSKGDLLRRRQTWSASLFCSKRGDDCSGIAGRKQGVMEALGVAAGGTAFVGDRLENFFRGEYVFRRESEFWLEAAEDFIGHAKADAGFKIQAAIEEGINEGAFLR